MGRSPRLRIVRTSRGKVRMARGGAELAHPGSSSHDITTQGTVQYQRGGTRVPEVSPGETESVRQGQASDGAACNPDPDPPRAAPTALVYCDLGRSEWERFRRDRGTVPQRLPGRRHSPVRPEDHRLRNLRSTVRWRYLGLHAQQQLECLLPDGLERSIPGRAVPRALP